MQEAIGPYKLRRKVGTGGLGVLYEASHAEADRPVLLRVINPEYTKEPGLLKRLMTEARSADGVEHPGFIPVFDQGELADGTAYLAWEVPVGETLLKRLKRLRGP